MHRCWPGVRSPYRTPANPKLEISILFGSYRHTAHGTGEWKVLPRRRFCHSVGPVAFLPVVLVHLPWDQTAELHQTQHLQTKNFLHFRKFWPGTVFFCRSIFPEVSVPIWALPVLRPVMKTGLESDKDQLETTSLRPSYNLAQFFKTPPPPLFTP